MIRKIQYVYGKNKNGKKVLLGAIVFSLNKDKIAKQEIYVGQIVESNSLEGQKKHRIPANAVGVLYFPQCDMYAYLEENDQVLPWIDNDSIEEVLEAKLTCYRDNNWENAKQNITEKYNNLEMDDPFVEFYDLPLRRMRCSDK